jgi:hypothetical protein
MLRRSSNAEVSLLKTKVSIPDVRGERIDALMKEVMQLIPCEYAFSLLQDNGWHCNYPIYENLHVQQMGHFSHEIICSYSSDVGL